jgi:acylphosphatase
MSVVAKHLMITGRVQGVFYRAWTTETASSLGLAGWVRNRMDGSVEVMVEGVEATVDQFIALARDGPRAAQVAQIDVSTVPPERFTSFEKRPTC